MGNALRQTTASRNRRRAWLAICTLLLALALAPTLPAPAQRGGPSEAGRLHLDLARLAKFANRGLGAPARQLARDLPANAGGLADLREPASTAEAELGTALSELRQMNALTLDPHYLPALLAAGRAYLALSGRDPLTGTTANPDYLGLERELAGSAGRLQLSADRAGKLSARVKRLARALVRSRRRARRLERQVRHAGEAGPRR